MLTWDFRILCAHNEGRYGVSNWNSRSDGLLPSDELRPLPVVVGVNDYTIGLFNGDDGVVLGNRAHFEQKTAREVSRSRLPQYKQDMPPRSTVRDPNSMKNDHSASRGCPLADQRTPLCGG